MRTLFDQYVHPENRLTHALVACLAEDSALLFAFLRWLGVVPPRGERLHLVEQRLPGEAEDREEVPEGGGRRLPDAWIYTASGWALLIESKIAAPIDAAQLRGHLAIAERRGFSDVRLLVLSPNAPARPLPDRCLHRRWRDLYHWACGEAKTSPWATHLIRYMPVAEQRMVDDSYLQEGTLTTFAGIPFGAEVPYTYLEAKRLLRLLMADLRSDATLDAMGANRAGAGRPSITGSAQASVWDFLPLALAGPGDAFNRFPHLTLSIQRDRAIAHLTLPNSLETTLRRRLLSGGYEAFKAAIAAFVEQAQPVLVGDTGAAPYVDVLQRHYLSQRSVGIYDAVLEFDPRTAFGGHGDIKHQEEWLRSAFAVLTNRRSNLQVGLGIAFRYGRSTHVCAPDFAQAVAAAWRATQPVLDLMRDASSAAPGPARAKPIRARILPAKAAAVAAQRRTQRLAGGSEGVPREASRARQRVSQDG
jgi:hypothetical protein